MSEQNAGDERGFALARLWWIPLVGTPLVVVLMLALRSFVHDVLALPVSYFLWFADLAFKSIPQSVCWAALLAMVIVVALKSLGGGRGAPFPKPKASVPRPGRVGMWAERIDLLLSGRYSRHRFGYYIGKLIIDVLSHEEQVGYRDIERRIEEGTLVVPPAVETYLMARLRPGVSTRPGIFARLKSLLGLQRPSSSPLTRELESVIQFLEAEEGERVKS